MSKLFKSGLTGSRKKARRRPARTAKTVEALNGLADCHYKLAALAALLEACGETMAAGEARGAGSLIAGQVRRLEELTTTLDKETR
jgi:alpha-beta hydrolase superfamily lysophospholipase